MPISVECPRCGVWFTSDEGMITCPICGCCFYAYEDEFRLTPLEADAARQGTAEQLALDAAQLKHGG